MYWKTKAHLIKSDPATVVKYFNHRPQQFLTMSLKSEYKPMHEVTDYFYHLKFTMCGSILYTLVCISQR